MKQEDKTRINNAMYWWSGVVDPTKKDWSKLLMGLKQISDSSGSPQVWAAMQVVMMACQSKAPDASADAHGVLVILAEYLKTDFDGKKESNVKN